MVKLNLLQIMTQTNQLTLLRLQVQNSDAADSSEDGILEIAHINSSQNINVRMTM